MGFITIYSRFPVAVDFFNPETEVTTTLKGMNSHTLEVPEGTPVANLVDPKEWEFIKSKYGNRPSYFHHRNGHMFFTAESPQEAKLKLNDSKPIFTDKDIVSKSKVIKQVTAKELAAGV